MNLSPDLQTLGQQRFNTLVDTHSCDVNEQQRKSLEYLLAMSDFVYDVCCKYEQTFKGLLSHLESQDNVTKRWGFSDSLWLQQDETRFFANLRQFRHFAMILIAADDFLKRCDIVETMAALSQMADDLFVAARMWAEHQLSERFGRAISDEQDVALIALGMGKLGGKELNFSSDIDLIFCFAEKGLTQGGRREQDFQIYFTKLAQKIIQALDTVTQDGRVFRVDMRLRPFGDSGPLVCSFDSIEDYYQDQGREWERYALLKARPLGHDCPIPTSEIEQQKRLMAILKPFVYKRYIDFSVIESLRNMKRMIKLEVKRRALTNNIKLGVGGIREVEFIVQALQMLRGGKEAQLQNPSLLQVLPELTKLGVFSEAEEIELHKSYIWLRQCEQYLQAFADKQTQTLPDDRTEQQRLVQLFECQDWPQLLTVFKSISSGVNQIFTELIGEPETEQEEAECPEQVAYSNLWLNGDDDTDIELGGLILSYREELQKSVSGARGREKLDALVPTLLLISDQMSLDDRQLVEVLQLIKRIASRTTYLELLLENRGALTQLIKLVSSCKFIGSQISRFPLLLDQLIDPKLLYSVPELSSYGSELRRYLLRVEPDDLETQMEVMRQFKLASQLVVAACDVEKVASLMQVSDHLTAIAECCLEQAVNIAWQQMVSRYGYPAGADDDNKHFAVLGYGKLGGFELGYGSDLDLVFVHDCDTNAPTNGNKQIESRQFYIKLAQRLMHLFTTRTLSGELYEIDTRLRPSGASGLLVINIETFREYQLQEAWTWEHQALVRCRMICGTDKLQQRFAEIRSEVLTKQRESGSLRKDIAEMRAKMQTNLSKENESEFDLKQSRGGIADIEFISQYLVLTHAKAHPELLVHQDNMRILEQAKALGLLTGDDFKQLSGAYLSYRDLYHIASLNNQAKLVARESVTDIAEKVLAVWNRLLVD